MNIDKKLKTLLWYRSKSWKGGEIKREKNKKKHFTSIESYPYVLGKVSALSISLYFKYVCQNFICQYVHPLSRFLALTKTTSFLFIASCHSYIKIFVKGTHKYGNCKRSNRVCIDILDNSILHMSWSMFAVI